MIKGLTHDEDGTLHKMTKYRGKVSTGFAPGEGPNNANYPVPAGFFRMMKEQVITERIGKSQKMIHRKVWSLNEKIQEKIEQALPNPNKTPRRVEIVCLHKSPVDMWESSLAMYSGSEGLLCKSHGVGTTARYLKFGPNGERDWIDREFNGKKGCLFRECQDFKDGNCKAIGLLKCYPTADMSANPYRFETRSINTIIGIESTLEDLGVLLHAAHSVKQMEAKKELPFDGFFGSKLYLVHKKIKSGGKDVFITDLMPTEEFTKSVMEPIKRGLAQKAANATMPGSNGYMSILERAGQKLLADGPEATDIDGPIPMDIDDQRHIAREFGADADVEIIEQEGFDNPEGVSEVVKPNTNQEAGDKGKAVTDALLNDNKESPDKG